MTVQRLAWDQVVRLNRYLVVAGKLCTTVWVAFICSLVLGVDWKQVVESAINSGKPVKGAFALAIIVPTLLFVAARSMVGFSRWRLQRELWRRDVERLSSTEVATSSLASQSSLALPPSAPGDASRPRGERS